MTPQRFTLTGQHIALARRMNVWWDGTETGAPGIDPKRPYGNSDVAGDIHEILTGVRVDGEDVVLSEEQEVAYLLLHHQMKTALQVILAAGTFEPGDFTAPKYTYRWERV